MTDAAADMPDPAGPSTFLRGMRRGFAHRCPNCGEGKLYRRYLKVESFCGACDHELAAYPADDGPAYFTILIVGHLIVAPLLLFPIIWQAPALVVLPLTLIPLTILTLVLLPRIKGAFIGVLWALGMRRAEDAPGGGAAEP